MECAHGWSLDDPRQTEYRTLRALGTGMYGVAWLCEREADSALCVVKQMRFGRRRHLSPEEERQRTQREADCMAVLQHENVVRLFSCWFSKRSFYIAMEYADGGDLGQQIRAHQYARTRFGPHILVRYTGQLLSAVAYLHERRVLHRDIKPENCFLSGDNLKLGDFGLARETELARTGCGTPYYMAPEVAKGHWRSYTNKCDVWSCGVLVYELMFLTWPFLAVGGHICYSRDPVWPRRASYYPSGLVNVARSALTIPAASRPRAIHLLIDFSEDACFKEVFGEPQPTPRGGARRQETRRQRPPTPAHPAHAPARAGSPREVVQHDASPRKEGTTKGMYSPEIPRRRRVSGGLTSRGRRQDPGPVLQRSRSAEAPLADDSPRPSAFVSLARTPGKGREEGEGWTGPRLTPLPCPAVRKWRGPKCLAPRRLDQPLPRRTVSGFLPDGKRVSIHTHVLAVAALVVAASAVCTSRDRTHLWRRPVSRSPPASRRLSGAFPVPRRSLSAQRPVPREYPTTPESCALGSPPCSRKPSARGSLPRRRQQNPAAPPLPAGSCYPPPSPSQPRQPPAEWHSESLRPSHDHQLRSCVSQVDAPVCSVTAHVLALTSGECSGETNEGDFTLSDSEC
eukprot:Hpha_TRINITY_DN13766_c0_g2::TRINITY_DN13766_c0_g2_i1::g.142698::m.142698/K08857/NEK1_4_5; NIMA (never in mitosis gene a)-related kinase 1/4/5